MKSKSNTSFLYLAALATACMSPQLFAITVTDLRPTGELGGTNTNNAITSSYGVGNGSYTAVGEAQVSSGFLHAFVDSSSDGSGIVDLGTLGGPASYAAGYATNYTTNTSYIAGSAMINDNDWRAFICEDDGTPTLVNLGTLGGSYSYGVAVNPSGTVVGWSETSTPGITHSFIYSGGVMTDIGGNFGPADISASGVVVGVAETSTSEIHAARYSDGTITDLGTLGGSYSYAYGIDDSGGIVGTSTDSNGVWMAFLYDGETMNNLGTLPDDWGSHAWAVNSASEVVGFSYYGTDSERAFIYSGGIMYNLETLAADYMVSAGGSGHGFTRLREARDINDDGYIVGTGDYWDGAEITRRAFVLSYH